MQVVRFVMALPTLHARWLVRSLESALKSTQAASRYMPVHSRGFVATVLLQKHARTGLYNFHLRNQGKMVPFGGYDMPLSYGNVGQGKHGV